MSGKYNGAQALITQEYEDCINSSCANHTLNLVGVECAKSCKHAITFFGIVQKLYTILSGSPTRWEILKKHIDVSLHQTSTTRWSARIDAVRPIARHFNDIRNAVNELSKSTNLTPECRADITGIKSYFTTFESLLMASIWVKVLSDIHNTNLVIQCRNATLDAERDNIQSLIDSMKYLRERWSDILNEASIVASNVQLTPEFAPRRRGDTQEKAKNNFKTDVFYVIIDSIIAGLTRRFTAVVTICNRFGFLWGFKDLKETELTEKASDFHKTYSRHVSSEIEAEIHRLRGVYDANFKAETPRPKELYGEIHAMGLNALFPNILTALRIFLTLPASVASNERSFSVLKRIKNYLRSNMAQERLNGLATLNINSDKARQLDFTKLIEIFAKKKARKSI